MRCAAVAAHPRRPSLQQSATVACTGFAPVPHQSKDQPQRGMDCLMSSSVRRPATAPSLWGSTARSVRQALGYVGPAVLLPGESSRRAPTLRLAPRAKWATPENQIARLHDYGKAWLGLSATFTPRGLHDRNTSPRKQCLRFKEDLRVGAIRLNRGKRGELGTQLLQGGSVTGIIDQ